MIRQCQAETINKMDKAKWREYNQTTDDSAPPRNTTHTYKNRVTQSQHGTQLYEYLEMTT